MAHAISRHGNCSICSSCTDLNMHELDYIAPTIGPYLQKSRASSWSPPRLASRGASSCGAMTHIHSRENSAIHILPSGQAVKYVPEHRMAQLVFFIKRSSMPIILQQDNPFRSAPSGGIFIHLYSHINM